MRNAAEVKSRGERIEVIMFHRVVNILDALVGIAVVVPAGGKHHVPVVFRRRCR